MECQMRLQETIGLGLHVWMGRSGKKYRYSVHMFGTTFGASPANFIYARELKPGHFLPLYIGETEDISEPFADYLMKQCIQLSRATHLHVHFSVADEGIRRAEQSDLLEHWTPPCNKMR
jgi:hypothetical protein